MKPAAPTGKVASNRRVLGRGASASLVLQGSGVALNYATQVVLARALGVAEFGTFTYAFTWARMAGGLCHLGTSNSSLRLLPEYVVQERWSLSAGLLRRSREITVGVGLLMAIVGSAIVLAAGGLSHTAIALVLSLGFVPAAGLIELQVSLTRSFEKVFRAFFPWLVLQPVLLIAAAGAVVALGGKMGASAAVLITGGSYVVTVGVQAWWLRASTPREVTAARPAYAMRSWWKVTLPIFFSANLVYVVFSRLDVVMVGILRSPEEAGIYAVAMRAGMIGAILQTAMASNLAPRISRLYWSDRSAEVEDVTLTAIRWVFFPTLLLTALMCLLATPLLEVFGKGFSSGSTVLILIALGQLASVSSGPVGWLMNLTGNQKVTAVVFGVTALLTIVGYLVLIPWLGIVGAAIANGGAVVVRNLVLNVLVRRRLGFRLSVVRALRPAR